MKKVRWVSATAGAALVAAMFALPGAGVAYASDNGNTTGNFNIPVVRATRSVPVNLCGNAVAAAGFANANCKGGSTSCIGSHCNHPDCQGQCHDCHGPQCQRLPRQRLQSAGLHGQLRRHPAAAPAPAPPPR